MNDTTDDILNVSMYVAVLGLAFMFGYMFFGPMFEGIL